MLGTGSFFRKSSFHLIQGSVEAFKEKLKSVIPTQNLVRSSSSLNERETFLKYRFLTENEFNQENKQPL
jgi:hypothetical protein